MTRYRFLTRIIGCRLALCSAAFWVTVACNPSCNPSIVMGASDSDGDEIADEIDNCPDLANHLQVDVDLDGIESLS